MLKPSLIPNILSCARIGLTPFFLFSSFLAVKGAAYHLRMGIIIYSLICLTDFLDGKIARYLKAKSNSGMILDLAADALFILSTSVCLALWKVLSPWAPLMMLLKLVEFIVTSRILASKNTLVFDPVGRVSAVLFYIIPIWTLLFRSNPLLMTSFLALTLSTTLLSSFFRVSACLKSFPKV